MSVLHLTEGRKALDRSDRILAAASTFSKVSCFGNGDTPFALVRGEGACVWDVDGNRYLDYMIALGCQTLGHRHPAVDQAIAEQLKSGISHSLPTLLEIEIAERLAERIPCAEMVKFGKNGNDATSAAVRLSRYVTGRNSVLFAGYHGWQDWYICKTSKNGGIPACVGDYSHRFVFNNRESIEELVERLGGDVACIITEPISPREMPAPGFMEWLRRFTEEKGIMLIFDEVVTGFRFHRGGGQALLGVTPDLACFSKAMANGMPLSAVVGRKDIMSRFGEIFYSLTNAGETLSLAACGAVMDVHDEVDVAGFLFRQGAKLRQGLTRRIESRGLSDRIGLIGHDCRLLTTFFRPGGEPHDPSDDLLRWVRLCAENGILTNGGLFLSLAHTDEVIEETLNRFDLILDAFAK